MLEPTPTLHQPLHSKVSNYLNDQRRTGKYCDLKIELESGDTAVFGHFCVVAAQSQFIASPDLRHKSLQFSINNPLKVTIANFSCAQCLQTLLDFFYEDVVSIATEHRAHFKYLAKMLAVTELLNLFNLHDADDNPNMEATASGNESFADYEAEPTPSQQNTANSAIGGLADEQQSYFKLKNPNADASNSKFNHCMGCDFKCLRVHDMITHMNQCEASHLTCSICEVGFSSWREYEYHLKKHSTDLKKPFFCMECEAHFMTRAALIIHLPKHSSETPHLCPHCGKGFKWKQGLSSHLLIHNKDKVMLCDVCGYSTTHLKALKSHKLQHTAEFFKCTYPNCNHRANRKENLKLHIETHKQERPFVCEVCGCKFSQVKNLKRHALKHSIGDTKKYKCELCSFGSHRSDKLKEHILRMHSEKDPSAA